MRKIEFIKVITSKSFIDRHDWVKYYTLPLFAEKILEKLHPEIFKTVPDEKFADFVQKQVDIYLGGKEVDKDIQTAVMNCADMVASGKDITLRAGDYIALQTNYQKIVG